MNRSTIGAQRHLSWVLLLTAAAAIHSVNAQSATQAPAEPVRWSSIGPAILAAAERERTAQSPASITIGIVDRSGLVWSGSSGYSDAQRSKAADEHTLYRAGSITKLFTDVVVMQYVERGTLDLDAPVQRYLPEFKPRNPYKQPITLRQLMSHRGGLIREPPLGHYFADKPVSLAQTVRSLNSTTLVAAPGTLTKYSNAGIAVVGRVLEVVSGKPYEQLLQERLLDVLGMNESTLQQTPSIRSRLAYAELAPFDAPRFVPPLFDLGMAPAGALYSNVSDLARFAAALLNGGQAARGRILEQRTLQSMWEPHTVEGAPRTFGIGFILDSLDGHRTIGHSGAIYGYVADLVVFPEDGFGVIVMVSLDEARHLMRRLRNYTARQAFALLGGPAAPEYIMSEAVPADVAKALAGHYSNGASTLDVRLLDGRVYVETSAFAAELRRLRSSSNGRHEWVIDDVTHYRDDVNVDPVAGTTTIGTDTYRRAPYPKPAPPSEELAGLIGEYGWEHNYVRIYERDGRPHVRIEWSTYEMLERAERDVYRFTDIRGMYPLEQLRFTRGRDGQGVSVSLNGIVFPRRDFGAQTEATVKANARSTPDLRTRALAASPPAEKNKRSAQLVEVVQLEPAIHLDIRYASLNNFMGMRFYDTPRAFLQKPAAESLARAHRSLAKQGYGIAVHDAYRPWYVTKMFWDATPESGRSFVADPSQGSRHNRGCAADITLFELDSAGIVQMPGRYDEMSARSSPLYVGGTSLERWRRDLLKSAVEAEGFDVYTYEWWHFDYQGWQEYPIVNLKFDEIATAGADEAQVGHQTGAATRRDGSLVETVDDAAGDSAAQRRVNF